MKYKFLYIFFISQIIYSQQFRNITDISDLNGIVGNNGVAVADYDLDGDLDIFIVSEDGNENISRLLQNTNNGNFIDVTENSGINQNLNHEIDLINYDDNGEYSFDTIEHGDRLAASWGDFNMMDILTYFWAMRFKVNCIKITAMEHFLILQNQLVSKYLVKNAT